MMKSSKQMAKKSEGEKSMLPKKDYLTSDEVPEKKRKLKADRKAAIRSKF